MVAATRYAAVDLRTVDLGRWGMERGFQQITEGLALRHLRGRTPSATVFQAAWCGLLYHMVQVLQGQSALAQPQPCLAAELSPEQIFYDVHRELTAVSVRLPPALGGSASTEDVSQEALWRRLRTLLASLGTPRWRQAVTTKPRPKIATAKQAEAPPSMPRL